MIIGKPRATLLELRVGDSALVLQGPETNLGLHETFLEIDGHTRELRVEVGGSQVTPENGRITLNRPILWENSEYDCYLRGPEPRFLVTMPSASTIRERFRGNSLTHYALKYESSVGDVALRWRAPQGDVTVRAEVFPTKLDYRTDFQLLKADLRRLSAALLTDIRGATGARVSPHDRPQIRAEWAEQVRREAENLSSAMRRLLPRLRQQVVGTTEAVPNDRIRSRSVVSRRSASGLAVGEEIHRVVVRSTAMTDSTSLNGHLRWEVDRLLLVGRDIRDAEWLAALGSDLRDAVLATLDGAETWRRELAHIRPVANLPHLQTRLRDPHYARAFTSLRRLRLGFEESQAPELLGLRDLAVLYEYWVYLQVVERLRVQYPEVVAYSPSMVREMGGQLTLVKGIESRIVLSDGRGRNATCYYNRAFSGLPTTNQRPDVVIEFPTVGMLILDAKYRLGRSPQYIDQYGMPGPDVDDINVLHRYRDAIRTDEGGSVIRAGLIAFPGPDEGAYRDHHFFRSWPKALIAGVPLLPGRTALLDELLIEAAL